MTDTPPVLPDPPEFKVPPDRARHFYPSNLDRRSRDGLLFPEHRPKFALPLRPGVTAFTIGSCFARNVEEELERHGLHVPTRAFRGLPGEQVFRANAVLNEFNPVCMARRIALAATDALPDEDTLVGPEDATLDLLLPVGAPVTRTRALARRGEIAGVYRHLLRAEIVVLTLGYVETWVDRQTGTVLNRMPTPDLRRAQPDRWGFHRMTLTETLDHLGPAMAQLGGFGAKVVLTVSPVPLSRSFTPLDCLVANEESKSILRLAAGELAAAFDHVDYFPSYEIVRSGGVSAYIEDHVHVREEVVAAVVANMIQTYTADPAAGNIPNRK